jgi:hypothetical protein
LDGGSARRKAAAYTQNNRTQTSMPRVGFEPTIPAFEWAKTVHVLDRAATVFGIAHRRVQHLELPRIYTQLKTSTAIGISVSSFLNHVIPLSGVDGK